MVESLAMAPLVHLPHTLGYTGQDYNRTIPYNLATHETSPLGPAVIDDLDQIECNIFGGEVENFSRCNIDIIVCNSK